MTTRVLLAGATGLIGRSVDLGLRQRADIQLISLIRPGSSGSGRAIDFERLCGDAEATLRDVAPSGVEVAISCLGTTMRAAGSEAAMYRVDHDYVLALAKGARALGARQFILVSSVGAGGAGFYLRTKGEIERDIGALGFARVDLMRPGLLLGQRTLARPLESLGQWGARALTPLLPGKLSQYAAIPAETVARAIIRITAQHGAGQWIHFNRELRALGD